MLSADYTKYEDVSIGPLKPGDIGILEEDDKSDKPYRVKASDGKQLGGMKRKFWLKLHLSEILLICYEKLQQR